MFKKGDFVLVKPGTILETGEVVNNWGGKIIDIFDDGNCAMSFDALTLDSLTDDYIVGCINDGYDTDSYHFSLDDLQLAERRDTDKQLMRAIQKLEQREATMGDDSESRYAQLIDQWIEEFQASSFLSDASKEEKEEAGFVAYNFMDFSYNYEGIAPNEWSDAHVRYICLDLLPRKLSVDAQTFENYGARLMLFISFLGEKNYILNAAELLETIGDIKEEIAIKASNPDNWGMAKRAIGGFMSNSESQYLESEVFKSSNPFAGITKNTKVDIEYPDGRIVRKVKFKKVEAKLRKGLCKLVE